MPNKPTSHRALLEACLSGESLERIPVALWRHFPVDDQSPETLAAAIAHFQHTYDFDLIKVTPASSYCLKDWGSQDRWQGNTEGTRDYTRAVVQVAEEWSRLKILPPTAGYLGQQLTCLRLLRSSFPETPLLATIFSPLAQAKNLVGKEQLILHLRQYPEALHAGLKIISMVTQQFITEAIKTGIDGIFYAVQQGQYGALSEQEFETFGKAYDLQTLECASDLWLNMVHIHGENIMFDQIAQYPVACINWHDRHTAPSLAEAQRRFSGVVCGGLRRWETMVLGDPTLVRSEAQEALQAVDRRRLILGTGCVLPIIAPHANILAARQSGATETER